MSNSRLKEAQNKKEVYLIPRIAHHEKYAEHAPIPDITNTATIVVSLYSK